MCHKLAINEQTQFDFVDVLKQRFVSQKEIENFCVCGIVIIIQIEPEITQKINEISNKSGYFFFKRLNVAKKFKVSLKYAF
jgi:hypothetical protein